MICHPLLRGGFPLTVPTGSLRKLRRPAIIFQPAGLAPPDSLIRGRAIFGAEGWRLAANDALGEMFPMSPLTGLAENFQGGLLQIFGLLRSQRSLCRRDVPDDEVTFVARE